MPLRDSLDRVSPGFLRGPIGTKLRYGVTSVLDALVQIAELGVKARMPDFAPEDALPLIGRDRRVTRGLLESSASYRARLKRWLDDRRTAGTAFSIMQQVQASLAPYKPRIRIVHNSVSVGGPARWFTLNPDGTQEIHLQSPNNWNWDGDTTAWHRAWLIIYSTSGPWEAKPLYDGLDPYAEWGSDQYTWGCTAKLEEVQAIQAIVADWKPKHESFQNIIVVFDAAYFLPTGSGAHYPDGTWGKWGKRTGGNVVVESRSDKAVYWDGVPA